MRRTRVTDDVVQVDGWTFEFSLPREEPEFILCADAVLPADMRRFYEASQTLMQVTDRLYAPNVPIDQIRTFVAENPDIDWVLIDLPEPAI